LNKNEKVFIMTHNYKMSCQPTVTFAPGPESAQGIGHVDSKKFSTVVQKLRQFCYDQGWIEVSTQTRPSILAACEQPRTLTTHEISGVKYALPQTGQMWLEYELLRDPDSSGFFCLTASYRDEPNPIPGRHHKVFPLFEMETKGTMDDMIKKWTELLHHLGYQGEFPVVDYEEACKKYGVDEIDDEEEGFLNRDYGPVVFLARFPRRSNPFWNMKYSGNDLYAKVDVILSGQETLGSAERSCNNEEMLQMFNDLEDGEYKQHLYNRFSQERVDREVAEYLEYDMFPRFGGGLGVTRLIRSMELEGLL